MEGLRTLEDHARFVAEDEPVVLSLKELRHGLAEVLKGLDRRGRLENRSTESDAGTAVSTVGEQTRADSSAVVPAACERVTQAVRQLEEFSKPLGGDVSEQFKQLRYQAYDVLAEVELKLCHVRKFPGSAQLYLLIDCGQPEWKQSVGEAAVRAETSETDAPESFRSYVRELTRAGVDVFQLRDKHADGAKLVAYSKAIQESIADVADETEGESKAWFIINDRVDIALTVGADGVHLGQEDLSLADARRLVGCDMWIGISTHDLQQAIAAEQGGADYIGCGPTFPSSTKQFDVFPGVEFSRSVAGKCSVPAFAIGGIQSENLGAVLETGVQGVAVSHAIHGAGSLEAAVESVKSLKLQFRQR